MGLARQGPSSTGPGISRRVTSNSNERSRCRWPLLLHSAHHALRHGRTPRVREQLTPPPSSPSSGCCCCFWAFLFPWYVCARRLLGRHYLIIPPLPIFFMFFFAHTAVRGVRSWAGAKRSLLRPCPMLLTSAAGSSELPCSHFLAMLHRYGIRIRRYGYDDTAIRHLQKIRIRRYGEYI